MTSGSPIDATPGRARSRGRTIGALSIRLPTRISLAAQYMLAGLIVLVLVGLVIGLWVGQQIEIGVLTRTGSIAALYVESFVEPHLQPLISQGRLSDDDIAGLDRLMSDTPLGERVVVFRVWSPDGIVLYSPDRDFINRRFPPNDELAGAVRGEVSADLSDLTDPENEHERTRWNQLLEVYVPVRERGTGRVIAVTEFYQLPDQLEADVTAARRRSWGVVAGSMVVAYLVLAGTVKRGSDTIVHQQAALRAQVSELSHLLEQNERLHQRVRHAAGRTTALNEQALRRISADLHDGPGQALALALLRLDAPVGERSWDGDGETSDFKVVHSAVRDALTELRAISAGLRIPALAERSVTELAERAVRDHERRAGVTVRLVTEGVPDTAPLPVKIALFRSFQEALSNSMRHGGGVGVEARVWADDGRLCLAVADRGPGFVPVTVAENGGLGLVGMRERAELLGGSFAVESMPGRGTTVCVCWPLDEVPDE